MSPTKSLYTTRPKLPNVKKQRVSQEVIELKPKSAEKWRTNIGVAF
jgi:hypothetical protein